MTISRITSAGLALLICASPQIIEAQEPDSAADDVLEEITVYGEKTTLELKREYELAEEKFFNLYNELNDDWRFDVVCRREAPTGSHIKQQVCWTRYELLAREQEGKSKLFRGYVDPGMMAEELFVDKEMRNRIAGLAEEDPGLLKVLIEYRDKYQAYQSERKKRCTALIGCGDSDED